MDKIIVLKESDDIITPLTKGEKVKCLECKNGIYRPVAGPPENSHYFVCDVCGGHIHFDPLLDI